jgi:AcrR family transcriptional regulator
LQVARTREDILMAAARAFMHSGFKAVSMHDIAQEVGFSAPALYAYFDSKEAIFAELVRTLGRELSETFDTSPRAGLGFREKVRLLLRRQLEWADRRRAVFAAFTSLHMRGEPVACAKAGKGREEDAFSPDVYLSRLARWLRQAAVAPADLGGHQAREAACLLMGISHAFFIRWISSADPDHRLADQADQILDFFFHGLSAPPRAEGSRRRTRGGPPHA